MLFVQRSEFAWFIKQQKVYTPIEQQLFSFWDQLLSVPFEMLICFHAIVYARPWTERLGHRSEYEHLRI